MKKAASLIVIGALVTATAAHADPSRYEQADTSVDLRSSQQDQLRLSDTRIGQQGESLPGTGKLVVDQCGSNPCETADIGWPVSPTADIGWPVSPTAISR
jgi:hypothetical protein